MIILAFYTHFTKQNFSASFTLRYCSAKVSTQQRVKLQLLVKYFYWGIACLIILCNLSSTHTSHLNPDIDLADKFTSGLQSAC